jgi:hypothetical protein
LSSKPKEGPNNFWHTHAGTQVEKRFNAWASYQLNDQSSDSTGMGNAMQGKPGDMPAGWHLAMDVEITLKEWGCKRVGAYIIHIYGKGGRAGTVDDVLLLRLMSSLYRNPTLCEQGIERVVGRAVLDFAHFMAKQRGLQ